MDDEFRVFLKIEDTFHSLPRKFKSIEQAVIIAHTIEAISGCEATVGVRLPVEDERIAGYVMETVEVDESEDEE